MIKAYRSFSKLGFNRGFSTLIIAEHNNNKLSSSTLHAVTASLKLKDNYDVVITGHDITSVVEQAQTQLNSSKLNKIFVYDHAALKHNLYDVVEPAISKLISDNNYSHIITASTSFGKDLVPRIAALFDNQPITDVIDILGEDKFIRPTYASNALNEVKSSDKIKFLTIRTTNFEKHQAQGKGDKIEKIDFEQIYAKLNKELLTKFVKQDLVGGDKPELTSAKIVVSGGRGMKSAENFKMLDDLANALGNCAIGASRAAVEAGYASNDMQIGQTGKVVAPELYFAIGISGAIQHLAGMKDSKVIVAVNKDPEAPIFQIANYGIVGDLFKIVPELTEKLKNSK